MEEKDLPHLSFTFAASAVLIPVSAVISWLVILAPVIGGGLQVVLFGAAVSLVIGLLGVVRMRRRFSSLARTLRLHWATLIAPVLGAGSLIVSASRSEWSPLWILQGDMVWNTAQSLLIHQDGGLVADSHPNPAPFTNTLFALAYTNEVDLGSVFRSHAIVVIAVLFVISLLSGLYASERLLHLGLFIRLPLAFGVGWFPFTGVLMDPLMRLGHANAITSLLVLWLSWFAFAEKAASSTLRASLLSLGATVSLASWAPMVVIPIALGVFSILEGRKQIGWRNGRAAFFVLLGALIQMFAYGAIVTLPDLRRDGDALGANGAAVLLSSSGAFILAVVSALLASALVQASTRWDAKWREGAGALLVIAAGLPVIVYLMYKRAAAGGEAWGYYPIKLASLLLMLLLCLGVVTIGRLIPDYWGALRRFIGAAFALPIYLFALLAFSNWGIGSHVIAPTLNAARSSASDAEREAIQDLVNVWEADSNQSVSLFFKWGDQDDLANGYLVQLEAERSTDVIRKYAYFFDREDPSSWCAFARDVKQVVNVFSRLPSEQFSQQYLANCPGEVASFAVRNLVPSKS